MCSSHVLGYLQVLLTLHAELFDKLPFFRDQPAQFLQHLLPELKLEYYAASEYVIWQGDVSTEMYFITHGMLEVRLNAGGSNDLSAGASATYLLNDACSLLGPTDSALMHVP